MNDPEFRQIYAFQSLAYSTHITNIDPNGLMNAQTEQLMRDVTRRGIGPVNHITYDTTRALSRWAYDNALDVILQPTWLPSEAARKLNRLAIGRLFNIDHLLPIQTYDA